MAHNQDIIASTMVTTIETKRAAALTVCEMIPKDRLMLIEILAYLGLLDPLTVEARLDRAVDARINAGLLAVIPEQRANAERARDHDKVEKHEMLAPRTRARGPIRTNRAV